MYGLASIKAINGWSKSKACKDLLEKIQAEMLADTSDPSLSKEKNKKKKVTKD